jgi:hypothetical protein
LNAFNFFWRGIASWSAAAQGSTAFGPLHRRFDLDRRVLHAAHDAVLLLGVVSHEFCDPLLPRIGTFALELEST